MTLAKLVAESTAPLAQMEAEVVRSTPEPFRRREDRCGRGHWFTLANTGIDSRGRRFCRSCHRASWATS